MSMSLVVSIVLLAALVPTAHLTRDWYRHYVAIVVIAHTPVLLIVHRGLFKAVSGLLLAGWFLFIVLPTAVWGGPGIILGLLPLPILLGWLLPPAPADRRSLLTISGGAVLATVVFGVVSAVVPEQGPVVNVCTEGPVDARVLMPALMVPHERQGYSLPPGARSAGMSEGGHAFRFDPFTPAEVAAFVAEAKEIDWVTSVRVDQPCPAWP